MNVEDFIISREDFVNHVQTGNTPLVENHIVVGDCVELLKFLPGGCVSLVHTSPPYNIDKRYKNGQPDLSPHEAYREFLRKAINEIKRVMNYNGSVFWQTGYTQLQNSIAGDILPIDFLTYQCFHDEPYPMVLWDRIIWRYFGGMAFKKKLTNKHETILWYVKPDGNLAEPYFEVDEIREKSKELDRRNNFWGRNPGNVWEVDRVAFGGIEQSSHIAVFPEEISEKIVRAFSQLNGLILDPFSGSGTLPKVARSIGRRWIAFEISEDYARESARRLGYQQPSEVLSLASYIIKFEVFRGRHRTMDISDIAKTLAWWLGKVSVTSLRSDFEALIYRALTDNTRSKGQKIEAWVNLNSRIEDPKSIDPVVMADHYLLRDYKNRRNLNGPTRYRTALDTLETLCNRVMDNSQSPESLVRQIAEQEPSSYRLDGTSITLLATAKRLKDTQLINEEPHFEDEATYPETEMKEMQNQEGMQPRLPL